MIVCTKGYHSADHTLLITTAVSCVILLALAILVNIVGWSIVNSIRDGVQLAGKIVDGGDLAYTLKSQSQDETGHFIDSLNKMGEKLRAMFIWLQQQLKRCRRPSKKLPQIRTKHNLNRNSCYPIE